MCVYGLRVFLTICMYVCVCCRLITLKQFMNAMKRCAVDISDTDGLRLMLRFDTEDNQRFDTIPLIKFMRRLTYPPGNADQDNALESSFQRKNDSSFRDDNELSSGQGGGGGGSAESFAWKTLKKQVEARLGQGDTPAEVFSLFDAFNRGNIDLMSLQKGSEDLG